MLIIQVVYGDNVRVLYGANIRFRMYVIDFPLYSFTVWRFIIVNCVIIERKTDIGDVETDE